MDTLGPNLFRKETDGRYTSAIATYFPRHELLVTWPPMHALQRIAFKTWLKDRRAQAGKQPLEEQSLAWEAKESVDLILAAGDVVQIRPEIDRLNLARQADRALEAQWKVPLHRIRYLSVRDARVRQALRESGALWRMSAPPSGYGQVSTAIGNARVGIQGRPIYYYNPHTGTRFLTFYQFQQLQELPDQELANHLDEIAEHSCRRNRHGNPEIAFFAADALRFGGPNFYGQRFQGLDPIDLHSRFADLVARFRAAIDTADFLSDDPLSNRWRAELFAAIATERREDSTPELVQGLSPEFYLRIRWLPGGSFNAGGFVFCNVFANHPVPPTDPELVPLWDPLAQGFIANFIREYCNIEYLNLGRIEPDASAHFTREGRRGVYLAEIKVRDEPHPRVVVLRLLRWGIRERLERQAKDKLPRDLVRAMFETEEYVDYTLDRRLGCLELGMHLPPRLNLQRVSELYSGNCDDYRNRYFPVIYFQRDYVPGIPTNKLPEFKLLDPQYALAFARLLGTAAAPNLVVGRARLTSHPDSAPQPTFDEGDEIVIEGSDGQPRAIMLVHHADTFADWQTPTFLPAARAYAKPVDDRSNQVPDPKAFANAYLAGLGDELKRIQTDYRQRQPDLDGLFRHLPDNPKGSFARRWKSILERLSNCDPDHVVAEVARHIAVL